MQIGILTLFHNNYNYGGQLQAYALQKYISNLGNTVDLIDYNQYPTRTVDKWIDRICRNYRILFHPKIIKYLRNESVQVINNKDRYKKILETNVKGNVSSVDRFEDFMKRMPHTVCYDRHSIKKISDKYDAIVLGGDQIWNPNHFFKQYYGTWVRKKQRIVSYAVSAGKDHFTQYELKKQIKLISKIPQISVREENFEKILKEKLKRDDIVSVVDPVFLLDVGEWKNIAVSSKISEKYIFAYLLNRDINSRLKITEYAKRCGLKIVTIPHARGEYNSCDDGFGDIVKYDVGPLEFLGLIKDAEYVFTDSFHGTCFSIIFHKQFYVIENSLETNATNARMRTILHKSSLQNRTIDLKGNITIDKTPINYNKVDIQLQKNIDESKSWIQNALNNVSKKYLRG